MEILLVTGIFPPDIGGPATYIPKLADSLKQAGETVKVVTLSDQPLDEAREYPVHSVLRRKWSQKRFNEVVQAIVSHGVTADLIFANGLFAEALQANRILKKHQINKVVADYAWEVASRKGLTQLGMAGFNKKNGLIFNFLRRARNYPAVQASSVIVPSVFLKNIVANWDYQVKEINVIPNGFVAQPPEEIKIRLPPQYLVCVGRLIPLKQFDRAIKLLKVLSAQYHLVIVGDGPLKNKLANLAGKLNLKDRVHLLGRLSIKQTLSVIKNSRLLLLLSTSESFPHVILEAMAVSVPVLASNTGALPEIISNQKSGLLVNSVGTETLKNAVMSVLEDSALVQRLVAAGQKTVERYSWERCFGETYELIKKTAGEL